MYIHKYFRIFILYNALEPQYITYIIKLSQGLLSIIYVECRKHMICNDRTLIMLTE